MGISGARLAHLITNKLISHILLLRPPYFVPCHHHPLHMTLPHLFLQMRLFHKQCREVNVVITTAMIPGKPAPKLITKEMVDSMKPGQYKYKCV